MGIAGLLKAELLAVIVMVGSAVTYACRDQAGSSTDRVQTAPARGVVVWRGMPLEPTACFTVDTARDEAHLRSTGWCRGVPMKAGVPWLTVLYRPAAERVVPFAQWRPCAGYDQCQTYTRRIRGLNLECYRAVGRQEQGSVRRHGCRSLEARVAIRYFCLDLFCDELERASTRAFAALGSGSPSGGPAKR